MLPLIRRSQVIAIFAASLLSHSVLANFSRALPLNARVPPTQDTAKTPEYDLTIRLIPEAHRMEVSGTLRIPPNDQPQGVLDLYLSALMKDFRVEVLEPPENAGPVDMTSTKDEDDINHWVLHTRAPFAANKPIKLKFSAVNAEDSWYTFYVGPEGSFGGANAFWYPRSGRGHGRLKFLLPPGYIVLSTGAMRSQQADEQNGYFEFENAVPTRFAFAAAKYTVLEREGVVPIRLYLLRPRANADDYLRGASDVLSTLSKEFGPYPYPEFAIAEVPPEQAHKASFSGASMNGFMLADTAALDAPFNLAFYGHEIGHQWWANLVSNAGGSHGNYMLDEALAQFGSLRVVETIEGAVAAEQYRRSGYPGYSASQSGSGYLLSTEGGMDHALGDLPSDNWSHELANSKGFLVWDLLSRIMGRERFSQALRNVTHKFAFQSVGWDDFLAAIQSQSKTDLKWFYSEWFERIGAPDWQVAWKQGSETVDGAVTQTPPFYRQTLEVELEGTNGECVTHTLSADGARTPFSWPVAFHVRAVVLDPHFYVLHWLPGLRERAHARGPALRAFQLSDAGKFNEAESVLRQALTNLPQPDGDGARYWAEYALAYMYTAKKDWAEAQRHFDAAISAPSRDPDTLPFLFYKYAQLAKNMHDNTKLRWAVDAAVSADAANGGKAGAKYWAPLLIPIN